MQKTFYNGWHGAGNYVPYYLYVIMVSILFWFIIFYLSFRFIFGFVVPLITTTRQVRTKMKDMHANMNEFERTNAEQRDNNSSNSFKPNVPEGDYIDFEEIK